MGADQASRREYAIHRISASGILERSLLTGQQYVSSLTGTVFDHLSGKMAQQLERFSPVVWGCIRKRAEAVSSVPMRLYTGTEDDRTEITDGEIVELIEKPHPDLSRADYWDLIQQITDARGYVLVIKDPNERAPRMRVPRELWPVDPAGFEAIRKTPSDPRSPVVGWRDTLTKRLYPVDQVMVHRTISRLERDRGLGPMEVAKVTAEADYLAARYQRNFIGNDCNPSAWATTERPLTDDEFEQVREHMRQQLQGIDKAGGFKLIEGVKGFQLSNLTHRDMQFLEGRAAMKEEICMTFGVPKSLLSATEATNYATAMAQKRSFWEETVIPLLRRYEDAWYQCILGSREARGAWVEFDTSRVQALQEDMNARVDRFDKLVARGVPIAQAARIADLPIEEFEGWEVPLVGVGLAPIDVVAGSGKETEVAPDQAPAAPEPAEDGDEPIEAAKLSAIVKEVASGTLPPDSAKEILRLSFDLEESEISALIDPAVPRDEEAGAESDPVDMTDPDEGGEDEEPDAEQQGRSFLTRRRVRALIRRRARRQRAERARRSAAWAVFQEKVVNRREAEFSRKMRGLFGWARSQVLRQFDAIANRAQREGVRIETILTPDDIARIDLNEAEWAARTQASLEPTYRATLAAAGKETLSEIGVDPLAFNGANPRWVNYINGRLGNEIRNVHAETVSQVRRTIRNGLFDGLTATEIRANLATLEAFSRERARTVAITEMGGTVNNTRIGTFEENGIDRVVWQTSNDEKVREEHIANERAGAIERGEAFPSGARWPHDPSAAASDVINCRCGIGAALEGE